MPITTTKLTRAAGLAAVAAGLLFIAVQVKHPETALLAVAAVATMAVPLLPMVNQRLFAVPNGIAMLGLGWSLWREQRSPAAEPATHTTGARLDPAGAR